MTELLRVNKVSVTYEHERTMAIEDVSFKVNEGEYICLLGANGSGKSTLMKSIVGLVKLTAGSIDKKLEPQEYAYMGQLNQIERNFPATVREIVLSGTQKPGRLLSFYNARDREKADDAMEMFGIGHFRDRRIGHLSGGQQQRVLLARAFCRNPRLLILDEPCAGLDPQITAEFYKVLNDYHEKCDITILMASHDIDQAVNDASRIIVMNRRLEFDGDVQLWKQTYGREDIHAGIFKHV